MMTREERLARALIKTYGFDVIVSEYNKLIYVYVDTKNGSTVNIQFEDWHNVLFRHDAWNSLNSLMAYYDRNIIDYSSLDELEIQLALIGCNDSLKAA